MLNFTSPISESHTYNNFSMKEKTPVAKINLRGNLENKDFVSRVGKILGMILPKETCSTSTKEKITCMWLGPNEWLLISNDSVDKESNDYELEQLLFKDISKTNLGAVTNVSDHYTIFHLTGSNIFEILSKGSPYDFNSEIFGLAINLLSYIPIFAAPIGPMKGNPDKVKAALAAINATMSESFSWS